MLWPSARARRAICGFAAVFRPRRKNVARTHSFLSASRILVVVPGQGPSSNVSTSSLSPSASVEGNSAANPRRIFDIDFEHPLGSECVRIAGARRSDRGPRSDDESDCDETHSRHETFFAAFVGERQARAPYTFNRLHEAYDRAYKHRDSADRPPTCSTRNR